MASVIVGWFVLLAPASFAVCAAACVWRKVRRPLVFLCVAIATLIVTQVLVLLLFALYLPPGEPNSAYPGIGVFAVVLSVAVSSPVLVLMYRQARLTGGSVGGA